MVYIIGGILLGFFITILALSFLSPAVILLLILSPVGFWQMFAILLIGLALGFALLFVLIKVLSAISR